MRPSELENSVGAHVTLLQKDSTKTIVKMLRMGRATLHSLFGGFMGFDSTLIVVNILRIAQRLGPRCLDKSKRARRSQLCKPVEVGL